MALDYPADAAAIVDGAPRPARPGAQEVTQIASVIGRDFSYALLRALAGMEDAPLQIALERLAEADILLVQGLPPELRLSFQARAHSGCRVREFAQEPGAKFCTAASARPCATSSPTVAQPSRSCWRTTLRRPV